MKKYLVELIGTFFLVLVIGLAVLPPGVGDMAPLAIGSALMVMVYAGGHISGGHYNPAVTFAVWMRGKLSAQEVPPYMVAQVLGALMAAGIVNVLKATFTTAAPAPDVAKALVVEILFTFAWTYVVLNTAPPTKSTGNSYSGLAIGCTLMAGAYAGGAISGGAYNPASAIGITLMGLSAPGAIWVFFVGNFVGGALAAVVCRFVNPDQHS